MKGDLTPGMVAVGFVLFMLAAGVAIGLAATEEQDSMFAFKSDAPTTCTPNEFKYVGHFVTGTPNSQQLIVWHNLPMFYCWRDGALYTTKNIGRDSDSGTFEGTLDVDADEIRPAVPILSQGVDCVPTKGPRERKGLDGVTVP